MSKFVDNMDFFLYGEMNKEAAEGGRKKKKSLLGQFAVPAAVAGGLGLGGYGLYRSGLLDSILKGSGGPGGSDLNQAITDTVAPAMSETGGGGGSGLLSALLYGAPAAGAAYVGGKAIQNRKNYAPFYGKRMRGIEAGESRAQSAVDSAARHEKLQDYARKVVDKNPRSGGAVEARVVDILDRKAPVSAERLVKATERLTPKAKVNARAEALGRTAMQTFKGNDPVKFLFRLLTRGKVK